MGKQSIDGDNGQTGSMLAGLLDCSQASCISSLTADQSSIVVEEETEGGRRTLKLPLPAVVTADLRLNTPRYPKLPDIVKAKKKPMQIIALDSLTQDEQRVKYGWCDGMTCRVVELHEPEVRKAGKICKDVDELIADLKAKGVL